MLDELYEIVMLQPNEACIVVWMETYQTVDLFKIAVENDLNLMIFVIDYSERRYCALSQSEVFHQALVRAEA